MIYIILKESIDQIALKAASMCVHIFFNYSSIELIVFKSQTKI